MFNWCRIKSFGELSILTKASYTAILAVPIISAFWPFLSWVANRPFIALNESTKLLQQVTENLNEIVGFDSDLEKKAAEIGSALESYAGSIPTIFSSKEGIVDSFPLTLFFAFFSSVLVALGHAVYQIYVPETVKLYPKDLYIKKEIDGFKAHKSEVKLSAAKKILSEVPSLELNRDPIAPKNKNLHPLLQKYSSATDSSKHQIALEIVEESARIEYRTISGWNLYSVLCGACYYGAAGCILAILVIQSLAITVRAGFL